MMKLESDVFCSSAGADLHPQRRQTGTVVAAQAPHPHRFLGYVFFGGGVLGFVFCFDPVWDHLSN